MQKTCLTRVVKDTPQPRGGFINPKKMKREDVADDSYRAEMVGKMDMENLHPTTVGVVVDYLTRYMVEKKQTGKTEAFDMECLKIARLGVRSMPPLTFEEFVFQAYRIAGLDDDSIDAMCMLTAWDTMYRSAYPVDPETLHPDAFTIGHIRAMVEMALQMLGDEPIAMGPTFQGGMIGRVGSADADYIRGGNLVDMKVSKKEEPDKYQTLQLASYFIMGKLVVDSDEPNPYREAFETMEGIEIINPRCGIKWTLDMDDVDPDVQHDIRMAVFGE